MARYIPRKGDFITLSFDPQSRREQKGRRPAVVVSDDLFNKHTGLAIVCPITNTDRGYPFHLPVAGSKRLKGFVMIEQVKSADYAGRHARFIEQAPTDFVDDVLQLIKACIR
jgi:mRNA interferase MazF